MIKSCTVIVLFILTASSLESNKDEFSSNVNTEEIELVKELLRLGETSEQLKSLLGEHYYDIIELIDERGIDISVDEGTVYVLGGDDDPDSNPNFNPDYSFGGKDDPKFNPGKLLLGGKDDPDSKPDFNPGMPMFGGKNDPDSKPDFNPGKPKFGGKDDPEFNPSKPMLGGEDDPDSNPDFIPGMSMFGGKNDPDSEPDFNPGKLLLGGEDDPDSKPDFIPGKPMFGGNDDPEFNLDRVMLGGKDDPDSKPDFNPGKLLLGGEDDPDSKPDFNPGKPMLGGKDDPDSKSDFNPGKPKFGGNDDPEFNPGKPMLGGEDDPDSKTEFIPGKPMFGGEEDPDSKPDFNPGKPKVLGRKRDIPWNMKRGRDPRKQTIEDSTREDMPMDRPSKYVKFDHQTLLRNPIENICADYECPTFKVADSPSSTYGFETRIFGGGKWIKSEFYAENGRDLTEIIHDSYKKLVTYTKGANSASVNIPMTAPTVVTFVTDPNNNLIPYGGTVMLWIPTDYQNDTPQPTNPEVSIFLIPDGNYTRYVRAIEKRFPQTYDYMREVKMLEWNLQKVGIKYATQYPTILDYYPPWDSRQHHEVMFGGYDSLEEMEALVQDLWVTKMDEKKENNNEEITHKEEIPERKDYHKLPDPYPIDGLCKDIECPPYVTVPLPEGASGFEMRKITTAKWVRAELTDEEIKNPQGGFNESLTKLLGYMEGENKEKTKIPVTIPLVVVWYQDPSRPDKGMLGGCIQLYIPSDFQDNPPDPTHPALDIYTQDDIVMMIRAFGGHPTQADWTEEFQKLASGIISAGIDCVEWDSPIIAGYTVQEDTRERNEIMFPQCYSNEKSSTNSEINHKEEIPERKDDHKLPDPYPIDELCKDIECPPYVTVPLPEGASGFEMRKYTTAKWVRCGLTDEEIKNPQGGFTESLTKLLMYMEGENKEKTKIPNTIPLVIVWFQDPSRPDKGMLGGSIQLYLPSDFQDNPPDPTNPALDIYTQDDIVMLEMAFGGHPTQADWDREFQVLVKGIFTAGFHCVSWDSPIVAVYTEESDPRQRYEIMFPQC